jgi:hypothetical protein
MISVESISYSDDEIGGLSPIPNKENNQSLDSLMADLGNMVKTPRPDIVDHPPLPTEVKKKKSLSNCARWMY